MDFGSFIDEERASIKLRIQFPNLSLSLVCCVVGKLRIRLAKLGA